jgi:hypothetical protein
MDRVTVASVLEAVVVYADGALCTRRVEVQPSDGGALPARVRVEGLPLALRPDTLRASVRRGPAGLEVREVRPDFEVRTAGPNELPEAQERLEAAAPSASGWPCGSSGWSASCSRSASCSPATRLRPRASRRAPPPSRASSPSRTSWASSWRSWSGSARRSLSRSVGPTRR